MTSFHATRSTRLLLAVGMLAVTTCTATAPASSNCSTPSRIGKTAPARSAAAGNPALEPKATAAIYFPFDDVIVSDPYKDIAEGLTVAFYVGQSHIVAGMTTDIVAYESDGGCTRHRAAKE